MKTYTMTEPNLDRFESEGGALAGQAEIARQEQENEAQAPCSRMGEPSWRVRPEFLSSLDEILTARDVRDKEASRRRNELSDQDEEFTQDFTDMLSAKVLPQFESVAALLSRRFYPVQLRVAGEPRDRVCFLAVSNQKKPANWASGTEKIDGPRMIFAADIATHRVLYTAAGRDGNLRKMANMKIVEVTDAFLEDELRQMFSDEKPLKTSLSGVTFLRAVRKVCS